MNYLASPPLCVAYALAGTMDIDLVQRPARATTQTASRLPARHLAVAGGGRPHGRAGRAVGHVPHELRRGVRGRRALERCAATVPRPATASPGTRTRPTCAARPSSRACRAEPEPVQRHRRGARCCAMLGDSVTTDHISPAGAIKSRLRRRAATCSEHGVAPKRLQLLRVAARQPRGDDARHVRQHPPAQPARAGHRGRRHPPPARAASELSIYEAAMRYARGGHAARRPRRQGVRLGLLARLGGQGHAACSACAPSSPRASSASTAPTSSAWASSRSSSPTARARESLGLTGEETFAITGLASAERRRRSRARCTVRAGDKRVPRTRAHRHAQGGAVLPPRRHPAVRAAPAARDGLEGAGSAAPDAS